MEFSARDLAGQERIRWYIQSAERKKLLTKDALHSKVLQQKWMQNIIPNKQKLGDFITTTKHALQIILKEVLQTEMNGC